MGQKLIDETGNRYGTLFVESLTKDKNGRTAWLCKCDCGKTKIARGADLRAGKIVSCGCMKGKHPNNIRDITGEKFGMLTAIKYEYSDNDKQYWSFKCDCGNICTKVKAAVISSNTQSCGCAHNNLNSLHKRSLDCIGQVYGLQKVIKVLSTITDRGKTEVLCECIKCGRQSTHVLAWIKNQQQVSCTCINSYPEYVIEQLLLENDIEYQTQYSFEDLAMDINNHHTRLRFDFAIFDNHKLIGLIEYNGEQHYKMVSYDKSISDLEKRQLRDQMKVDYCKQNHIPLLILTKESDKENEIIQFISEVK